MKVCKRNGVSELLTTLILVAITLSFGAYIAQIAISQDAQQQAAAQGAASQEQAAANRLLSLVYATVTPGSGGCITTYSGATEGTSLNVAIYDYGSTPFDTAYVFVNGTVYGGSGYGTIEANSLAQFTLTMSSCIHQTGQTILLVDVNGGELQIQT